jgi:hypothetical protein
LRQRHLLREARRRKKEKDGAEIVEVEVAAGTAWILKRGHLLSEKFLGSLKNSLRHRRLVLWLLMMMMG